MKNIFIIVALLSVAAMLGMVYLVRRRSMSTKTFFIWTPVWVCVFVFSLWPDLLSWLLAVASMEVRAYFVFLVGIIFLLLLTFYNSLSEARSTRAIHLLMQEVALLRFMIESIEEKE